MHGVRPAGIVDHLDRHGPTHFGPKERPLRHAGHAVERPDPSGSHQLLHGHHAAVHRGPGHPAHRSALHHQLGGDGGAQIEIGPDRVGRERRDRRQRIAPPRRVGPVGEVRDRNRFSGADLLYRARCARVQAHVDNKIGALSRCDLQRRTAKRDRPGRLPVVGDDYRVVLWKR